MSEKRDRSRSALLHFLRLLLWEYPFRREPVKDTRNVTSYYYIAAAVSAFLLPLLGPPAIWPSDFPVLDQATVVEGHVIRHPTIRKGRYTSEPLGIQTVRGPIFKQCTRGGMYCLDPNYWISIEGQPARMWIWNEWAIQLEVNGVVPPLMTYEHQRNTLTSYFVIEVMGGLAAITICCVLIRVSRRYGDAAASEAFDMNLATQKANRGRNNGQCQRIDE